MERRLIYSRVIRPCRVASVLRLRLLVLFSFLGALGFTFFLPFVALPLFFLLILLRRLILITTVTAPLSTISTVPSTLTVGFIVWFFLLLIQKA